MLERSYLTLVLVVIALLAIVVVLIVAVRTHFKVDGLHEKVDQIPANGVDRIMKAIEGGRQQMDVQQGAIESEVKGMRSTVNSIWRQIEKFFKGNAS